MNAVQCAFYPASATIFYTNAFADFLNTKFCKIYNYKNGHDVIFSRIMKYYFSGICHYKIAANINLNIFKKKLNIFWWQSGEHAFHDSHYDGMKLTINDKSSSFFLSCFTGNFGVGCNADKNKMLETFIDAIDAAEIPNVQNKYVTSWVTSWVNWSLDSDAKQLTSSQELSHSSRPSYSPELQYDNSPPLWMLDEDENEDEDITKYNDEKKR